MLDSEHRDKYPRRNSNHFFREHKTDEDDEVEPSAPEANSNQKISELTAANKVLLEEKEALVRERDQLKDYYALDQKKQKDAQDAKAIEQSKLKEKPESVTERSIKTIAEGSYKILTFISAPFRWMNKIGDGMVNAWNRFWSHFKPA